MKRLAFLSTLFLTALCAPSFAITSLAERLPDGPQDNIQIIYSTPPALECYVAAQTGKDLKAGLMECSVAVDDPTLHYLAQTLVNRGIIRYDLGDQPGALHDFMVALNINPALGDAYLNRALVLLTQKNDIAALAAINQGIALGASNLQVAYYIRGEIEDDAGHYAQAYRDYKQALAIKPDYAPAQGQLARFKVTPR